MNKNHSKIITRLLAIFLSILACVMLLAENNYADDYYMFRFSKALPSDIHWKEQILSDGSVIMSMGFSKLVSYTPAGATKWTTIDLGGSISSVKVTADEARIYATVSKENSQNNISNYSSYLVAIDNKGVVLWQQALYLPDTYRNIAAIEDIFPDGTILVSSGSWDVKNIYQTGKLALFYPSGSLKKMEVFGSYPYVKVSPDKGRIYATVMEEFGVLMPIPTTNYLTSLYYFDRYMNKLLREPIIIFSADSYLSSAYIEGFLQNGSVIVSGGKYLEDARIDGKVEAYDLSGSQKWTQAFQYMPNVRVSADHNSIYTTVTEYVYIPESNMYIYSSVLYAINGDGTQKWSKPIYPFVSDWVESSVDDVLPDGTVIVHAWNASLTKSCINKVSAWGDSGQNKWENDISGSIASVVTSHNENRSYVLSINEIEDMGNSLFSSSLTAFDNVTGSSSWPMAKEIYPSGSSRITARIDKVLPDGNIVLTSGLSNPSLSTSSGKLEIYESAGNLRWGPYAFQNTPDLMLSSDNLYMYVTDKTNLTLFSKQYAISVHKLGTGQGTITGSSENINCGDLCAQSYEVITPVTLTATPLLHSYFAGWSGACTGLLSCDVDVNDLRNVYATFNLKSYRLKVTLKGKGKVTSKPAGISCGSDCTQNYTAMTRVTLTAKSARGHKFVKWSGGGCSGKKTTCSVTMESARTVTAKFK